MASYVTARDAAAALACSERTIKRMVYDGRLKGARVINHWRIDADSLDSYYASLTTEQQRVLDSMRHQREISIPLK
jgi:excisionase family DNA binding protein